LSRKFFGVPAGTKPPAKEQTKLSLKTKNVVEDEVTDEQKGKSNGSTKLKKESSSQEEAKKSTIDNEGDDKMEDVPASSPGDKDDIHGKNGIKRLSLKEERSLDSSDKIDKAGLYTLIALYTQAYLDSFSKEKIAC